MRGFYKVYAEMSQLNWAGGIAAAFGGRTLADVLRDGRAHTAKAASESERKHRNLKSTIVTN